jgi:hypothetical protein
MFLKPVRPLPLRKWVLLVFFMAPVRVVWAQTETPTEIQETPAPTAVATPAAPKSQWAGRFGLGLNQVSITPSQGLSFPADNLTLFSVRYGLSDTVILEVQAGGTSGVQLGIDPLGNPVDDPYWAYCFALGDKVNLVEPAEGLWVQMVNRYLYYENSTQQSQISSVHTDHFQTLSLSTGLGFEYFLPFAKSLSLETNESLEFDTNWETYITTPRNNSPVTSQNYSTWVLKTVSPGFNLTSLSVHYYF